MPGHTINKLLTPPPSYSTQFHMWKKVLMRAAQTSDHLCAVKLVIDYSVEEPHISA